MWASVAEFLTNILQYIGSMVTTITSNTTIAVFVLAIPLVSFAVVLYMCYKCVTYRLPSPGAISE